MKIETERFDRQLRVSQVGREGQEKLAAARVMIVGCGALGTYTAEQLLRGGVGELILVDFDVVELSNLQRQTLFTLADAQARRPKVLAAAQALQAINPAAKITAYQETFDQALFEDLGTLDLLLDCTDNFLVRQLMNDFCWQQKLPFVFASAAGTSGQVMAISPADGPCLSCIFPNLPELEQNCETIGVITPLIPLISAAQVSLAYQILIDKASVNWETMQVISAWPLAMNQFTIKKQAHCPVCQNQATKFSVKFDRTCGGVFQAVFPEISSVKFDRMAQLQHWQVKSNAIAWRVKFDQQELTVFRNGRVLFYDFPDFASAQVVFQLLEKEWL